MGELRNKMYYKIMTRVNDVIVELGKEYKQSYHYTLE